VGLKTLKQHAEMIVVPDVSKEIEIPVIGKIKVKITGLHCVHFQEPRNLTKIEITSKSFYAKAQEVSATFEFHWHWETESLPISGSGGVKHRVVDCCVTLWMIQLTRQYISYALC
jgi:hypothetical protein